MIEVQNLYKTYGHFDAVKNVSFKVESGEIVGLLGPNGAGKTTIMKILTCYHFPTKGDAVLNGNNVYDDPLNVKKLVGYLPESAPLYTDLNVHEYLSFIADSRSIKGDEKSKQIEWVINECGLNKVVYKSIDELSKGFKQRVGLAQAIIHDPEILILDEPTTGLDPNQIIEIRKLIKKLGQKKTVILSTHILQEVEALCSKVLILNEGRIAAEGTTEEIGRELKGETIFNVELLSSKEIDSFDSLKNIKGVKNILENNKLSDGKYYVKLSTESDQAGEDIFDWAVSNKYKIVKLIPEIYSLEDIFIKLTGDK